MSDTETGAAGAEEGRGQPFSAADIRKVILEKQAQKAAEEEERARQASEQQDELRKAFEEREIRPDVWQRIHKAIEHAVASGESEVKVIQFPTDWLTDGGRAINNGLDNWPETLTGFAKRAYDFYEQELKERGFGTRAAVVTYPDGMPGDVALFLSWDAEGAGAADGDSS